MSDLDRLKEFHGRLTLGDIRCVEYEAKLVGDSPSAPSSAQLTFDVPRYYLDDEERRFAGWIRGSLTYYMGQDELAKISVAFIVDSATDPGEAPDSDTIAYYLRHNTFFVAYPYIREAFHSAAARLGLPQILLAILNREEGMPESVRIDAPPEDSLTPTG